ncbi:FAD-binding protein [Aureispira anguillae]|uniref:FAD-binding protein n=1 Tax=Aureispira anguillae TaxID=2864201 RepID=A0A915YBS3_9BACT|nr:FAD-binding protein [Aureispira anguillae]BDS10171.1 FAD-binding protein [Aureispira anguillae]
MITKDHPTNKTLEIGSDGFYHPTTEDQIIELIKTAQTEGLKIRVRGSAHSVKKAIYTNSPPTPTTGINIMLDQYRAVFIDSENMTVTCQAGVNLGKDPYDPSGTSTVENSLLYQLDQAGLALPDLGGIRHQTVAGFLATGSSGGSLNYDLGDSIEAIRLIDGTGSIHTFSKTDPDPSKFYAAGVSMGLLGIVTQVTFKCTERYHIMGSEAITTLVDAEMDLLGSGTATHPSYEDFLRNAPLADGSRNPQLAEYSRILWWPQKGVNHIVSWKAHRMIASDYTSQTGTAEDFNRRPYVEMGYLVTAEKLQQLPVDIFLKLDYFVNQHEEQFLQIIDQVRGIIMRQDHEKALQIFQLINDKTAHLSSQNKNNIPYEQAKELADKLTRMSELVLQALGGLFYLLIGHRNAPLEDPWKQIFDQLFADMDAFQNFYPSILKNVFVKLDGDAGPQQFWDTWWQGLPMDNQIDDHLLPTWFTEIWIPVDQTQAVMNKMNDFFEQASFDETDTFSYEFYATTKSKFWMSPSYDKDVVRVDVFWFGSNYEQPTDRFYPQFWDLLKDFDYRLHWGKFLVQNTPSVPSNYIEQQYPKWNDWMNIRQELDPNNLFLTNYWKTHLNIS